jgi:hypothetical protein
MFVGQELFIPIFGEVSVLVEQVDEEKRRGTDFQ